MDAKPRSRGESECPHHPGKKVVLKCLECPKNTLVCLQCVTTMHNRHEFIELEVAINEEIENITKFVETNETNTIPQLTAQISDMTQKMQETEGEYQAEIKSFRDQAEHLQQLVEFIKTERVTKLEFLMKESLQSLDQHIKELEKFKSLIEAEVKDSKSTIQSANHIMILDIGTEIAEWKDPTIECPNIAPIPHFEPCRFPEFDVDKVFGEFNSLDKVFGEFNKDTSKQSTGTMADHITVEDSNTSPSDSSPTAIETSDSTPTTKAIDTSDSTPKTIETSNSTLTTKALDTSDSTPTTKAIETSAQHQTAGSIEINTTSQNQLIPDELIVTSHFQVPSMLKSICPAEDNAAWIYSEDTKKSTDEVKLIKDEGKIQQKLKLYNKTFMSMGNNSVKIRMLYLNPKTGELICCCKEDKSIRRINRKTGEATVLFHTPDEPLSLACIVDNVIVGHRRMVCMYNNNGDVLHQYKSCTAYSISVSPEDDRIALACGLDGLILLGNKLKEVKRYKSTANTGEKKIFMSYAVFDNSGRLLVGDKFNASIYVLDSSLHHTRTLHTDKISILQCLGTHEGVLWVGCSYPDNKVVCIPYGDSK